MDDPSAEKQESPVPRDSLITLAVDRPVAVTMIVLAVAVFGFISLQKLPRTLLPEISYPSLTVRTEYPGSAPAEVEELVTKPLENNLAVISNLNSFRSISRAGVSDLILEFEWDTDMSFSAQDVREKVDQIRPFLPQDVKKPLLLKYDPTLDPVMRLGLYGPVDLERMRFFAEERLEKRLESIPGVAAVRVRGGFESEIRVDIDETALRQYRISVDQIQTRLREENINLASGILREGDVEYLVRTLNEFRSVREIQRLVVGKREQQMIRLGDVARVHKSNKEPDVVTRINGQPSVEIAIFKEDSSNVVQVAHDVKVAVFGAHWRDDLTGGEYRPKKRETSDRGGGGFGDEEQAKIDLGEIRSLADTLPGGMKIRMLSDQSRFIENSVSEVQQTGMWGALFAILILLIFLRNGVSTLIIAISIPISVIATFGPMMQFDVTLNIMSLGGLALGIGMLVDASIVVLESIDRCRKEGDDRRTAAIRGTREVGGAVFASVLTTVAVFFPIVFVHGIAGEIFKDQSLVVVFSLLASLAVALFFIPMLTARKFGTGREDSFADSDDRVVGAWAVFDQRVLRNWNSIASARAYMRAISPPASVSGPRRRRSLAKIAGALFAPLMLVLYLVFLVLEAAARVVFCSLIITVAVIGIPLTLLYRAVTWVAAPGAWLFDQTYAGLERSYELVLIGALRARGPVIIAAGALLFFSARMLDDIGMDLIPEMHSGEIIVEAPMPVGTSLETTSAMALRCEELVEESWKERGELDILGYSSSIGVARDEIAPAGEGPHTAKIYMSLPIEANMAAAEERAVATVRKRLSTLADVGDLKPDSPKLFTVANKLEVQVKGDNLEQIEKLALRLETAMAAIEGLKDVRSTVQEGSPEFVIRYDRVRLAERGLTLARAAGTLRDKIKGVIPTKYSVQNEGRKIDILVKIPEEDVTNLDALRNIEVGGDASIPVRLADVATISQGRGPSEVRHIGGERAVIVTAEPDIDLKTASRRVEEVVSEVRRADPELFRGVVVKIAGQTEEAERSSRELLFALALALVLVYIVMASQFESLLDPLVIMGSSIFAAVGAVFALYWLGISASIVVFIGGIMLAGIVVNNAIVLVDCINRLHRAGQTRHEAILSAGRLRLRPILMTTATTVLGLIPMAISTGEGAEMRVPMAVTVIAGLDHEHRS